VANELGCKPLEQPLEYGASVMAMAIPATADAGATDAYSALKMWYPPVYISLLDAAANRCPRILSVLTCAWNVATIRQDDGSAAVIVKFNTIAA
jgi:hypothetical protein